MCIRDSSAPDGGNRSFPLTIFCRDLPAPKVGDSLGTLFGQQLRALALSEQEIPRTVEGALDALQNGSGALLIDGLDEIESEVGRRVLCRVVRRWRTTTGCRVVMTTRTGIADELHDELDIFEDLRIPPLDAEFKASYIEKSKALRQGVDVSRPVSYTHLTLPTIYSV